MRSVPLRFRHSLTTLAGAVVLAGAIAVLPSSAATAAVPCAAPVPSTTQPGYTVADPNCDLATGAPFVPLTGASGKAISRVYTGIRNGAAYRIEVPLHWNGDLALFAHGYRGAGTVVWVDSPELRAFQISQGFAWAASSYQTNGYDVGQGVKDSQALIDLFRQVTGERSRHVYMTGESMGGQITAVTIEHFRGDFVGAMPYCGVLGDASLFNFFDDVNLTAAAITGTPVTFPLNPTPEFLQTYTQLVQSELPALGNTFGQGVPPTLTAKGKEWSAAVEQRSGGTRPGFDSSFGVWTALPSLAPLAVLPFHFGLYPGLAGGTVNIAGGNVTTNQFTVYQLDGDPRLSPAERKLNRDVLRVGRTEAPSRDLSGIPYVAGDPGIPVLSLHDIGDLFVPFSMEQAYAARMARHGQGGLFVSRAIRGTAHCDFNQFELQAGFTDLVTWVRAGQHPAGDAVLDPRTVAKPSFGCHFTVGVHANFTAPACR